jgi:hypothetical protein
MPIDPQDGYPDDWVRPALAPLDDDYPDDWFVPPSAQGAGFPDDWVGPVSAPSASQAAPGPQPGAMASARPNPPASDSFAAFLPFMPVTRAAMSAWRQPLTGDAFGQSALPQVWQPALPPLPAGGLFGWLASPQPATKMQPFSASSLFGGDTPPTPEATPYNRLFGGVTAPQSASSDAPSPTLPDNGPYRTSLSPLTARGAVGAFANPSPLRSSAGVDPSLAPALRQFMSFQPTTDWGTSNADGGPPSLLAPTSFQSDPTSARSQSMGFSQSAFPTIAGTAPQDRPIPAQWFAPFIDALKPMFEGSGDSG